MIRERQLLEVVEPRILPVLEREFPSDELQDKAVRRVRVTKFLVMRRIVVD